ncbi:hypothetical protein PROFUN_15706 [Planoprotostelium fungivorum]|uniref:Uncharacterized protein n=1 Tax=Planoprotostelium fungivorum TaxID=1890364 RepID=A0A2P6MSC3_9EUKA|nr:hypothetical protein PROFUN_15706 [Planoprotostelium fungivorum]
MKLSHALQNYMMSFTSTLPIKSWDEFLAGVWHLFYNNVNAMEKAIQKLNSARQSVGQPVLAWRNELEQKAMEVSPVLATQPILARLFHSGLLDIIKSSSIDHFPVGGFTTILAAYKWAWQGKGFAKMGNLDSVYETSPYGGFEQSLFITQYNCRPLNQFLFSSIFLLYNVAS